MKGRYKKGPKGPFFELFIVAAIIATSIIALQVYVDRDKIKRQLDRLLQIVNLSSENREYQVVRKFVPQGTSGQEYELSENEYITPQEPITEKTQAHYGYLDNQDNVSETVTSENFEEKLKSVRSWLFLLIALFLISVLFILYFVYSLHREFGWYVAFILLLIVAVYYFLFKL